MARELKRYVESFWWNDQISSPIFPKLGEVGEETPIISLRRNQLVKIAHQVSDAIAVVIRNGAILR
jgi:hypothetical protein